VYVRPVDTASDSESSNDNWKKLYLIAPTKKTIFEQLPDEDDLFEDDEDTRDQSVELTSNQKQYDDIDKLFEGISCEREQPASESD